MAVSIKLAPTFKGESAKKLVQIVDKPSNNTAVLKKCKELSKIFIVK